MESMKPKIIKLTIQILVSTGIIYLLFRKVDISSLMESVRQIDLRIFCVAIILLIPNFALRAYRWKLLFDDHCHHISFPDSMALLLAGLGLNLFLPAGSGDVAKAYLGYRWTGIKERMLSVSLLDKLIALGSVSVPGIYASIVTGNLIFLVCSIALLLPLFAVFFAVRCSRGGQFISFLLYKLGKRFDLAIFAEQMNTNRKSFLFAMAVSVAGWVLTYIIFYMCFLMLNSDISLNYVFSAAPLLTLARLFPFALNGLGSDEAIIGYLFAQGDIALAAALIYRLLLLIIPGIVGLSVIIMTKKLQSAKHDNVKETNGTN